MRLCLIAASAAVFLALTSSPALAEPTSWLALGGGASSQRNGALSEMDTVGAFSATIGVGTTARAPLVVGGVFRTVTSFSLGTDLGLATRFASRGFCHGDWGVAVDLGVVGRFWKRGVYGEYPLQGVVTVGAPWGFQIGVGVEAFNLSGPPQTRGGFAVLELDLLRFTVMRQGSTSSVWKNPLPADGGQRVPSVD